MRGVGCATNSVFSLQENLKIYFSAIAGILEPCDPEYLREIGVPEPERIQAFVTQVNEQLKRPA